MVSVGPIQGIKNSFEINFSHQYCFNLKDHIGDYLYRNL